MKEFLSNSWVISIISGIIVFILTNIYINIRNKSKYKKQIYDANRMILNHLRGYIVDNGFPKSEIIEALRLSVAREYMVKDDNILNVKSICEELVKDIIGNTYISNDNKKKYMEMLQNYLEKIEENEQNENDDTKNRDTMIGYISHTASYAAAIITSFGGLLVGFLRDDVTENVIALNINSEQIIGIMIVIIISVVFYIVAFKK